MQIKKPSVNSYLIIGPSWVGDLVMAQSLFKLIKQREPECILHIMVPAAYMSLVATMPEIAKSIALPFKHGEFNLFKRWQVARELRKANYTHSIVLPNSWKSALIPFLAGIPKRIGWKGEARFGLINDIRYLNKAKLPLMIQRFCALALPKDEALPATLPYPQLKISPENILAITQKWQLNLDAPILALCPGAEFGPAKRWPAHHYAAVAKAKQAEGWQVWILGTKTDSLVAEAIQNQLEQKAFDFTGKTDLQEAIALLSLSTAVVSNDSGLMHIANAVNRPVVVVYGSSSPQFTPPLSQSAAIVKLNLDCQPCFQRQCPLKHMNCLNQLLPEQVLKALSQVRS